MIPFFRRIRRKLANDNQFLKYSRYAIGEIVLVVVGILIALQINTWNDRKKEVAKFNNQLIKVQDELERNLSSYNSTIESNQEQDSLFDIARSGILTRDMIEKNNLFAYLTFYLTMLEIRDLEFKNISELNIELNKSQDSILKLLNEIYINQKPNVDMHKIELKTLCTSNYKELSESKTWVSKWHNTGQIPEEAYAYFINDPYYLNQVSFYSIILFNNLFPHTLNIRDSSIQVHRLISKYFHQEDTLLNYPVDQYKHYLGLYQSETISIRIENRDNKLYFLWTENDFNYPPAEIFPISKTCFTAMDNTGFYYLRLNANNNVVKLVQSHRGRKDEYIKVD